MPSAITSLKIPQNTIKIWTGLIANIPKHWQICDGTNSTPDLRSSFVRGAPNATGGGGIGGSDTVTLDSTMIPSHNHGITDPTHVHGFSTHSNTSTSAAGSGNTAGSVATSSITPTISINNQGGGGSHNNKPAYYEVIYIMKVTSD
jgi:microcystin-dependent protein